MAEVTNTLRARIVDIGGFGISAADAGYGIPLDASADAVPGLDALVADAVAAGVPLILPAGRYLLDQMWEITDRVHVVTAGPETVFVCNENTGSLAIRIAGTEGSYLSGVRFGGFTIERSDLGTSGNGNGIRVQFVEDSAFGDVIGRFKGGGIFSIRDLRRVQFGDVIGAEMGGQGSGVFTNRIEDCQFGRIIVDGAAEGIDFADSDNCQVESVLAHATDEAVDMGNSRHIQVGKIIALGCQALNCKVENDAGGGSWGNQFGMIVCLDAPAGTTAVNFGNGPPVNDGERQDSNQIGRVIVWSENPGVVGLRAEGGLDQPISENLLVGQADIRVDGIGLDLRHQKGAKILSGYVESASARAIRVRDCMDVSIDVEAKGVGDAAATDGAVQIVDTVGYKLRGIINGSPDSRSGLFVNAGCARGDVDLLIRDTPTFGAYIRANGDGDIPDIASRFRLRFLRTWTTGGSVSNDVSLRLENTGNDPVQGLDLTVKLEDDQVTPTTRGVRFQGAWDHGQVRGGDLRAVVGSPMVESANLGTGMIVRDNLGAVTENAGTATITSGITSVNVSHGCLGTPAAGHVHVTPRASLGSATEWWVSGITGSQFTLNVDSAPGASVEFAWAVVRPRMGA